MPNMRPDKVEMPVQDPNVRNKNFDEVALGYTEEMAVEEATRCINCKNKPCMGGCPVRVRIPEFIEKVANHFTRIRFSRHYTADNLNHDVYVIYY